MKTILEFVMAYCVGWFASFVLLLAYENEHPKCEDIQLKKQINQAFKKLCFRAGLVVAVVWLLCFGPWKDFSN